MDLLSAAASEWSISRRGTTNPMTDSSRVAILSAETHDVRSQTAPGGVLWNMGVEVAVVVNPADADATEHGGNAYRLLDARMVELEQLYPLDGRQDLSLLLGVPEGCVDDLRLDGMRVVDVDETGVGRLVGVHRFTVDYRHDLNSPGTYGGAS